ncbi:hypothetical protein ACWD7Y_13885 [Streptomyces drozdowiczii]
MTAGAYRRRGRPLRSWSQEPPGPTGRRGPAARPPSRQASGAAVRRRTVHARFELCEAPGITVGSAGHGVRGAWDDAARSAAQRALAEAGRSYLGGRLELRTHGPIGAARDRRTLRRAAGRAAALAVAATLRGEDTGVSVRAARR